MVTSRVQVIQRIISIIGAFVLAGCACGEEPAGYYSTAEGKTGAALKQALHDIIDGHAFLQYTRTDEAMELTDRDPDNPGSVILIYSRRTEPASCCTGEWNREHVWPNSLGIDSSLPAHSDLHNLRPSDFQVNQRRGHKFFDESDETDVQGFAEPAHPEAPLCSADSNSWEPPESIKGDIARAMFYMAVRYEGGGGEPDLELTDNLSEITTSGSKMGRLTTLLIWHLIDPVSELERDRNDGVFASQGNRNPFIDHPEWVNEIWPSPLQLDLEDGGTDSVTLTWPAEIPRSGLEYSLDLLNWLDVEDVPLRVGASLTLNQTIVGKARRFYRLVVE